MKQNGLVRVRRASASSEVVPGSSNQLQSPRKCRGRPRKPVVVQAVRPGMLRLLLGERQAEAVAAAWLQAPLREIRQASRRPAPISEARQVGMYLAHKVLNRSMTRVGHVFGRDRTTVRHACSRVDRMRGRHNMDRAFLLVAGALLHLHAG
jgi:hypothetical protein